MTAEEIRKFLHGLPSGMLPYGIRVSRVFKNKIRVRFPDGAKIDFDLDVFEREFIDNIKKEIFKHDSKS